MADLDRKAMDWEDIESHVLTEISDAQSFVETNVTPGREKLWDRYYGKPLGNEKRGRSKFMSRDVMDTIEWMLPYFLQLFTAGEHKIKVKIKSKQPKEQTQQMQNGMPQMPQGMPPMQPGMMPPAGMPPAPQLMPGQMPGMPQQGQQMQSPAAPEPIDPLLIGEALRTKIDQDLDDSDRNRFKIFYEWFKDALVSGTSYVKVIWFTDAKINKKTLNNISPMQMKQIMDDPEIDIIDYKAQPDGMFTDVKVESVQLIKDEFQAEGVPHWEMLIPEGAKDINDDYGKGQRTEVTIDYLKRINRFHSTTGETGYFKHLDELESGTSEGTEGIDDSFSSQDSEKRSYEDFGSDIEEGDDHGPRRRVKLVEWYDRIDVDGDGFLEDVIIWVADNRMIRWELNEEGFVQFASIKPIIDCYKFHGIAWADLIKDIQNLKTMIVRRTLDNFDFTNLGRWRVSPNAQVDIRSLMNNIPGEVVRAEQNEVEDLSPRGMDTQTPLMLLGYTDQMKQERSGVSKISQGQVDPGSMMQTQNGGMPDRGIERLMTAAQQRLDLIARIFAETGMKDFYKKAVKLYQNHLQEPFTVTIRGEDVTITPGMIQGRVITTTSLSIESAVGQQDAVKIQQMFSFMMGVAQSGYQPILDPDKVYRMVQQYISGLGWTSPDEFLPSLQVYKQGITQLEQQQQQQAQMQMQMQQKQDQTIQQALQLEKMDRDIKKMAEELKTRLGYAKIQQDERESRRSIMQSERDSKRDFQAQILKLLKEGQTDRAKSMLEAAKIREGGINNGGPTA